MGFPFTGALKMPRPIHDAEGNIPGVMQSDSGAK
jgi:hypothetical protein